VGFRHRFLKPREDPLRHLLEIQEQLDFPIFLVPQMVMYSQDPTREDKGMLDLFFGDRENPGRLRKLGLCFRKSKKAVVEVAEPVNLQEYLADPAVQADPGLRAQNLRRELIQRLDQSGASSPGRWSRAGKSSWKSPSPTPGSWASWSAWRKPKKRNSQNQEDRAGLFLGNSRRFQPDHRAHHAPHGADALPGLI
jgi:hypothetical protein